MEPLRDFEVAVCRSVDHRTSATTLSSVLMKPHDDVEMAVPRRAIHSLARRPRRLWVKPLDNLQVVVARRFVHAQIARFEEGERLAQPLDGVHEPVVDRTHGSVVRDFLATLSVQPAHHLEVSMTSSFVEQ
jgi:hypothetical protein